MSSDLSNNLVKKFEQIGQGQIFKFFDNLSCDLKQEFIDQVESIDLDTISFLIEDVISNKIEEDYSVNLQPVEYFTLDFKKQDNLDVLGIIQVGEEALRSGRVGALVAAGGQGVRLGLNKPKGILPITPLKRKSFFQVFAEKIKAAQDRYQKIIPWYVMTSYANYEDIVNFFDQNDQFGLTEIYCFKQGLVPLIDANGKFLLDERGLIEMSSDGHGGCFEALVRNDLISKMERSGVDILSYFQVDNPLLRCIDPLFIGLHIMSHSEMSSKIIKKIDPNERVGLFCKEAGKLKVMEYFYVSEEMRSKLKSNGELLFNAGNVGAHLLDRKFVKKIAKSKKLRFHKVRRSMPLISNGLSSIKFEKLIFDALEEAKNPILMEVSREEEFSPVKNIEGKNSPISCRKDQLLKYARWLKAVNIDIPYSQDGSPLLEIEISPLFADSEEIFVKKWNSLLKKPKIVSGIYLE